MSEGTCRCRIVPCVPMRVARIHTVNGDGVSSRVEPPLGPEASEVDQLRWKAAVCEMDTRVPVRIDHIPDMRAGRRFFVTVGLSGGSAMSFSDAWQLLSGVELGAQEARR